MGHITFNPRKVGVKPIFVCLTHKCDGLKTLKWVKNPIFSSWVKNTVCLTQFFSKTCIQLLFSKNDQNTEKMHLTKHINKNASNPFS